MISALRHLLDELARKHGHARFPATVDEPASFTVNDDLEVFIAIEDEALVLYARVGEAPEGNVEFAEELLASNLFWRDTEGATLSLERYTRAILLARRHPAAEFSGADALDAEIDRFAALVSRWQQTIERLLAERPDAVARGTIFTPSQLA